jgi:hypothetical protein
MSQFSEVETMWRREYFLQFLFLEACLTGLLGMPVAAALRESNNEVAAGLFNLRIDYLHVENADVDEALLALRSKDPEKILIGFEKMPQREDDKTPTLSATWTQATVGEILAKILAVDKRYTYEVVEGKLIHVFPIGAKNDLTDLLNIRIERFAVKGKESIENVVIHIAERAPELREFLEKRASEYRKRKALLGGGPGQLMSGDMDPEINLELRQKTVRDILHGLVLYSAELYPKKLVGIPPTSWKYEFIIDPEATTGLGGYPRWSTF